MADADGRAERFIQTMLAEWASHLERSAAPRPSRVWLDYYQHNSPHTSVDGLAPMQPVVNNVSANHT
jgi:hypothetical protein